MMHGNSNIKYLKNTVNYGYKLTYLKSVKLPIFIKLILSRKPFKIDL